MSTFEDLLVSAQSEHRDAAARRKAAHDEVERIIDIATREGRANLTPDEDARVTALFGQRDAAAAQERAMQTRIHRIEAEAETERQVQRQAAIRRPSGAVLPGRRDARMHVVSEARTYRPDEDPRGVQFLWDVVRGQALGMPDANARLAAHMNEERVERPQYLQRAAGDTTTGNWAGLTVPQYLTDMYAPATAALRPLADHANIHPLPPDGMSVNISRVTTPSAVALQTTELSVGGEQSMDDTLLTIPVQSILGDQTVSRQAVDRGTGIDDVVLGDLFRRVATLWDSTMINQAVTGLSAAAQVVTYTDASPTPQLLYPNLGKGQSLLEQALLGVAVPDYIVMHPRRWNWFTSTLGTTWPLVGGQGVPAQSGAITFTNEYGSGVRGVLPNGMKVIVDANIPVNLGAGTNQDEIYVIASQEVHTWEDPNAPMYLRAEQTKAAQLGVVIAVWQYAAYTVGRYTNNPSKISGTGLAAPAGY